MRNGGDEEDEEDEAKYADITKSWNQCNPPNKFMRTMWMEHRHRYHSIL